MRLSPFGQTMLMVVALLAARPAAADDSRDKAFERFRHGQALFEAGQFAQANDDFIAASALNPDPLYIYWAAQANMQLRNWDHAAHLYRNYLALAPDAPNRAVAEAKLKQCEDAIAASARAAPAPPAASPPPPPAVYTPLPSQQPAPPPGPAAAEAGQPPFLDSGPQPSGPLPIAGGPEATSPLLQAQPAAPAGPSPPLYTRWWFWTAIGVVVVGVVTGVAIASSSASKVPDTDLGSYKANW